MRKVTKIYDAIHQFISLNDIETLLVDSPFFQRLRYIHQLGIAYLLYPGAFHKRFDHSLGVMHLASQLFNAVTDLTKYPFGLPLILQEYQPQFARWHQILRLAALVHDLGHLPFSHTAEKYLLDHPAGHEYMSYRIILSEEMLPVWEKMGWENERELIAKIAIGPEKMALIQPGLLWSDWELILSQLITDPNFGADRIDYLLRDAHHTGVKYGYGDHAQIIETLVILEDEQLKKFLLGVQKGGIHAVEALLVGRYFMYARVYEHRKMKAFSMHLRELMKELYTNFSSQIELSTYKDFHDFQVLNRIQEFSKSHPTHPHIRGLQERESCFSTMPYSWETEKKLTQLSETIVVDSPRTNKNFFDPEIWVREADSNRGICYQGPLIKIPLQKVQYIYCLKEVAAKLS